jgi:hypothetical protein
MYHDPIQLLEDMNWPKQEHSANGPQENGNRLFDNKLNNRNSIIMDAVANDIFLFIQSQGPVHKDIISMGLGISNSILAEHLLVLELNGLIHLLAGNQYTCS